MLIAGLQKTTLIDFPGKVAATVFTRGCSFRCGFCHNPELVLPEKFLPVMEEKEVLDFLESRQGKLEGICLTGGEPLLFADTKEFLQKVKAMGYLVKLDSNGSFPDRLGEIINAGLVDYIAMDIKSPLEKYSQVAIQRKTQNAKRKTKNEKSIKNNSLVVNSSPKVGEVRWGMDEGDQLEHKITLSINLIMNSGLDYEFRTTVVKPLLAVSDFEAIGRMIKGSKRYFIQNFVETKQIDEETNWQPFSDDELTAAANIMRNYVSEVSLR